MFDFESYCEDLSLEVASSSHKHSQKGWIQVECPFCEGNEGFHLGFNISKQFFNCWRCGWKTIEKVVGHFSGITRKDAIKEVVDNYPLRGVAQEGDEFIQRADKVTLPFGSKYLSPRHKAYLKKRGFDPDELIKTWSLKGTGPVGGYKLRVIAPIHHRGVLISYQGRDITDKQKLRYKACSKENELIDHKDTLYGFDEAVALSKSVVVCEGITDVWKLGPGAVATFGTQYKPKQFMLLSQFKEIYVLFDCESTAQETAMKLATECSAMTGAHVELIQLSGGDPAELSNLEAKELMNELLNRS